MRKKMNIICIGILITISLNCCMVPNVNAVTRDAKTTKKNNKKNVTRSNEVRQASSFSNSDSENTDGAENESTDSDMESSEENKESSTTQSSETTEESSLSSTTQSSETIEESSMSSTTQSSSEISETSEEGSISSTIQSISESSVTEPSYENTETQTTMETEKKKSEENFERTEKVSRSTSSSVESNQKKTPTETINFKSNQTTKKFIVKIGSDARILGLENDLYASVMIAQAILESASGNSALASPPYYNIFGIKGKYQGLSVSFATNEDDGNGNLYTIQANFKTYSSYRESLEDYVSLIRMGLSSNPNYYSEVWKSNTVTYKDATKALTGKYATDSDYAAKLNGLIHTYNLVEYDKKDTDSTIKKEEIVSIKNEIKDIEKKSLLPRLFKSANVQLFDSFHLFTKDNNLYQAPLEQVLSRERLNRTLTKRENNIQIEKLRNGWIFTIIENHSNGRYWKPEINYVVKKGDSLKKISNYVGISVSSLRLWNELTRHKIYEGQILKLTPDFI